MGSEGEERREGKEGRAEEGQQSSLSRSLNDIVTSWLPSSERPSLVRFKNMRAATRWRFWLQVRFRGFGATLQSPNSLSSRGPRLEARCH